MGRLQVRLGANKTRALQIGKEVAWRLGFKLEDHKSDKSIGFNLYAGELRCQLLINEWKKAMQKAGERFDG